MAGSYTTHDHLRALKAATDAGDAEAASFIRADLLRAQQEEDRAQYNPTSGMGLGQLAAANVGAGVEKAGIGLAQLALPKSMEQAVGITDESINERRARDNTLGDGVVGGHVLQAGGEMLPGLLIPGGVAARGLGMIPKVGNAIRGLGVGSRVLPTVVADGAVMGAAQGAATPTTSEDSVLLNTLGGATAGAVLPAGLAGLGAGGKLALQPFSRRLQEKSLASRLGQEIDTSRAAQSQLQQGIAQSAQRGVNAPQSLATVTQDPAIARMELAARANPDTAASWVPFDEAGRDARWGTLAKTLGDDASVTAAKAATDKFASVEIPKVFAGAKPINIAAFKGAVKGRLDTAVKDADPARQEVFGYVADAMDKGGGSPQMLWNIRKTLRDWSEGTPPPGKEGTRGAKVDVPIRETVKAIDNALNQSTGNRWSKFLSNYGTFARKEGAQKAGQNIRNTFFDETLLTPRGATTTAGNPAVTRAKLEQALQRFGKNDFGETLDQQQRVAVDQVLGDLRGEEILQRVKSSMTGKGGSQTAPLQALMRKGTGKVAGGWFADVAQLLSAKSQRGQQQILNDILQSPHDALALMQHAERLKRPLTASEKHLVQASRAVLASPSALVLMNQQADEPSK